MVRLHDISDHHHVSLKGTISSLPRYPRTHSKYSIFTQNGSFASPRCVHQPLHRLAHISPINQDKKSHSHRIVTAAAVNALPHPYGARYGIECLPKFHMPSKGTSAETAYQLIHDELSTDGHPTLKSVSCSSLSPLFKFFQPCLVRVHLDARACQQTHAGEHVQEPNRSGRISFHAYVLSIVFTRYSPDILLLELIHTRCVSILADLWHAPSTKQAIGTATTGSSEAIQLGGLAMKRLWQERRKAAGKSIYEPGPNIVMGANAQVALEKFARYFEVECRLVPVSIESKYRLDPKKALEFVDENTIGVYIILGSTYTGHYEPVKEMADLLDEYEKETGHSVPIHGTISVRVLLTTG